MQLCILKVYLSLCPSHQCYHFIACLKVTIISTSVYTHQDIQGVEFISVISHVQCERYRNTVTELRQLMYKSPYVRHHGGYIVSQVFVEEWCVKQTRHVLFATP